MIDIPKIRKYGNLRHETELQRLEAKILKPLSPQDLDEQEYTIALDLAIVLSELPPDLIVSEFGIDTLFWLSAFYPYKNET